ncbi:MAG: hypothetical protein K2Y22_00610 [Candidatus Obscuribacterales bacterium]|nr:hypothetical protein [Candidatus Obscuribacterales bacterium]
MVFDWQQYLDLAKEQQVAANLESGGSQEAKLRCAISRAYYSVFNIAKAYLKDRENDFALNLAERQKGGEHFSRDEIREAENSLRSIHGHLRNRFKKALGQGKKDGYRQSIAKILQELCDERVEADYESNYSPKPQTLKKQINDAEQLLTYLKKLAELT